MSGEKIKRELIIIDSLLRSKEYAYEMAKTLHASADGKNEKEFLSASDETSFVYSTVREEKIAINLAGFYALECGVGLLCEQTKITLVEWLKLIAGKTADSNTVLLLNRFANATWKAGQPFRSLDRITRYNFTGAGYLSAEEVKKDYDQISSAATLLLEYMQQTDETPLSEQMYRLKTLLHDEVFAYEVAKYLDAAYHINQHEPVPLFLTQTDNISIIQQTSKDQKIAISIAGFYALECGINYLVTSKGLVPTDILKSIINDRIDAADMLVFLRLANATWKAGQPFRGIKRITRDIFVPAYFLNKEDLGKDMVQIKTAAHKLLIDLEGAAHKR